MSDFWNYYDIGEPSKGFKDALEYCSLLDGLENRPNEKDKENTEQVDNTLTEKIDELSKLLTIEKVTELNSSSVIKDENCNISENQVTNDKTAEKIDVGGSSSNKAEESIEKNQGTIETSSVLDKESHSLHHNPSLELLEKLESCFVYKSRYSGVEVMKEIIKKKKIVIMDIKKQLGFAFQDIDGLLEYLISYSKRYSLDTNDYLIILIIYFSVHPWRIVLNEFDKFGLDDYIFDKVINERHEPILNNIGLAYIYEDLIRLNMDSER